MKYIKLSPPTIALMKQLKGVKAIDRLTKQGELVVTPHMYNELDRKRGFGQSFDSLIYRMLTIEKEPPPK